MGSSHTYRYVSVSVSHTPNATEITGLQINAANRDESASVSKTVTYTTTTAGYYLFSCTTHPNYNTSSQITIKIGGTTKYDNTVTNSWQRISQIYYVGYGIEISIYCRGGGSGNSTSYPYIHAGCWLLS